MDRIDLSIIEELRKDGRLSLSALGRKIGMSHVAIRRRINKLIEGKIMRVSTELNVKAFEFKFAFVMMEVETYEKLTELVNTYTNCPRTLMILHCMGGFNLLAMMWAEDDNTLKSVLDSCSIRTREGVRRSEVCVGELLHPEYLSIPIVSSSDLEISPCGLDCSKCRRYREEKCIGCPATRRYKGIEDLISTDPV
ncbi:MAG TPA: AsnC family transcriptional regulator [Candidatus Korarchaeota archaeon]|nr:AsnC family transcriptional regulator [Candidatus Korarchaeota archaeon]